MLSSSKHPLRTLIFAAFLLSFPIIVAAQNAQSEYIEAKRLFNNEQFSSAKGAFGALTDDPNFGNHASFYYALSAYRQGDVRGALDMFSQLLIRSPKWENNPEVLFWLAYINLEEGRFDKGILFAEKLSKEMDSAQVEQDLYTRFLKPVPLDTLKDIYERHDSNRKVAYFYTQKLMKVPYEDRAFDMINRLNAKWNFEAFDLSLDDLPLILKSEYEVVVAFPFMYDTANVEMVLQNNAVMGLYQGMLLAANELKSSGVKLNLKPLDTKRNPSTTESLLNSLNPDSIDLIVGPLVSGPVGVARNYSLENKVNMINPISSTSDVIGDNPYAFLFKPTYETMALALADQAIAEVKNKNAMIFYENNERDSLFAVLYKKRIEEDSFNVVWFQELNNTNAKAILDTLTAQYEVFYTQEEADSILLIPDRYVKSRRIRRNELKRIENYENGKSPGDSLFYQNLPVSYNDDDKPITYYENLFYMEKDSIGHILGATRKNFMANSLISAVETKGDSTRLYGYGEWIDFTMVAYQQLERIGVSMVYPEYIDYMNESYKKVKQQTISSFNTFPTVYHLLGYELTMQIGGLMKDYGKYFQKGLRDGRYVRGIIYQGIKYGVANDNQVVPVVKFENAELRVVNKFKYEDRPK